MSASTTNSEYRRCAFSSSGSVIATTMANAAPWAPDTNHFSPSMTQSSPSCTALVRSWRGSELATSCSVMAKQERTSPAASGFR